MSKSPRLNALARRALAHLHNGTTDQAPATMALEVAAYGDPDRFRREFDAIFLHRPLALALTVELPQPGMYVARTMLNKPLLFVRGQDGTVRAFLNVCRHRGARVCPEGSGKASRFVCPYHRWTYDRQGQLVGVNGVEKFGDAEKSALGLRALPCAERAGVIWAALTPDASFDIDDWLGDFRAELETLDLADWHLFEQRTIPGPGWKVTMDGYLEAYHHDSVHANTLAKHTIGNLCVHVTFGPHQRLVMGRLNLAELNDIPEADWDAQAYIRLIHSIFPNFSISGIRGGHCLVSQILPGDDAKQTLTIQTILSASKPDTPEKLAQSQAFSALALEAVGVEDYPVGFSIQAGLDSGANDAFLIGRNEPGIQHYHRTVAQMVGNR